MKNADVITDDAIFFESYSQPMFQFLYYASENNFETNRRYQILQDVLGSLSRTTNLLIIIGAIIVNINNKISFVKQVLNTLYVLSSNGNNVNGK